MTHALKYSYNTQETKTVPKQDVLPKSLPSYESIKKNKIAKLNKLLSTVLAAGIIVSMVSYSAVIANENHISKLHKEISDLNYENIELENKLENVKSFYSVDDKIARSNLLDKPEKVIEVDKIDAESNTLNFNRDFKINSALGY